MDTVAELFWNHILKGQGLWVKKPYDLHATANLWVVMDRLLSDGAKVIIKKTPNVRGDIYSVVLDDRYSSDALDDLNEALMQASLMRVGFIKNIHGQMQPPTQGTSVDYEG